MSTLIEDIGTENLEEIDISDILPNKVIHIYPENGDCALCGAGDDPSHNCPNFRVLQGDKECPSCKVPYCSYCLLLAENYWS